MAKFKIGQTVKIINQSHEWGDVDKGDIGVIKEQVGDVYRVKIEGRDALWKGTERCFEAIGEEPEKYPFDAARALAGEKVITRNGTLKVALVRRMRENTTYPLQVVISETNRYEVTLKGEYYASGTKHGADLFMASPAPPEPKAEPVKTEIHYPKGTKVRVLVSLNTGRPVKVGNLGTITGYRKSGLYDVLVRGVSKVYSDTQFVIEQPESTKQAATAAQPNVKIEDKKIMAATKTKMATLVEANKSAAIAAAKIEAGSIAVNRIITMIRPKVPMLFRGYLDTPIARVVVANIFNLAIQQYAPTNEKAAIIGDAMMEGAMLDFVKAFKIDDYLDQALSGIDISKLSGTLSESAE